MISPNLENRAKIGKLKKERVSQTEFDGLVKSGRARLADARTPSLSIESRFDLAYNASHALALNTFRESLGAEKDCVNMSQTIAFRNYQTEVKFVSKEQQEAA